MTEPKSIVHTRGDQAAPRIRGRHPFNPDSEMAMTRLGELSGLKRVGVNLIRLPPGKQSFIPHAHALEEEYAFVIEGRGIVTLDGEAYPIGPGDFIGFPTDGVVHHLTNTGEADLVYLTGGERSPVEIARMPTLGKIAVFKDNAVTFHPEAAAETVTMAEWFERARIRPE
jgi:uncharacterized cupin superfamily protein